MLHMIAVYGTSALFKATGWWRGPLWLYCVLFYATVFGATFLLAHLSYRYLESPFLRLKEQRFSLLPSSPAPAAP
jgi:peptidoglycan/LPS O-acetylase OafA/YrhL